METGRELLQLLIERLHVPVDCATLIKLFYKDKEIGLDTPLFETASKSADVRIVS